MVRSQSFTIPKWTQFYVPLRLSIWPSSCPNFWIWLGHGDLAKKNVWLSLKTFLAFMAMGFVPKGGFYSNFYHSMGLNQVEHVAFKPWDGMGCRSQSWYSKRAWVLRKDTEHGNKQTLGCPSDWHNPAGDWRQPRVSTAEEDLVHGRVSWLGLFGSRKSRPQLAGHICELPRNPTSPLHCHKW